MHRIFLLVVALLALSRVQLGGATCHGHNCDEEHERAVEAGLLGDSRDDAPVDSGAVRPKECKAGKVYPKDKLVPLVGPCPYLVAPISYTSSTVCCSSQGFPAKDLCDRMTSLTASVRSACTSRCCDSTAAGSE